MSVRGKPDKLILSDGKGTNQRKHSVVRLEDGSHIRLHHPNKNIDKELVGIQSRSINDLVMARRIEFVKEIQRREGAERGNAFRSRPIYLLLAREAHTAFLGESETGHCRFSRVSLDGYKESFLPILAHKHIGGEGMLRIILWRERNER